MREDCDGKKTSIYKNYRHLKLENGDVIEKDMVDQVDWRYPDEKEQSEEFELNEIANDDVFPVKLVPKEEWNAPEIKEAMEAEISKFKDLRQLKR